MEACREGNSGIRHQGPIVRVLGVYTVYHPYCNDIVAHIFEHSPLIWDDYYISVHYHPKRRWLRGSGLRGFSDATSSACVHANGGWATNWFEF